MDYTFTPAEHDVRHTLAKLIAGHVPVDIALSDEQACRSGELEFAAQLSRDGWLDLLTEPEAGWHPGDLVAALYAFEEFGAQPTARMVPPVLAFLRPLLRYLVARADQCDVITELFAAKQPIAVAIPDALVGDPADPSIGFRGYPSWSNSATGAALSGDAYHVVGVEGAAHTAVPITMDGDLFSLAMARVVASEDIDARGVGLCTSVATTLDTARCLAAERMLTEPVPSDDFSRALGRAIDHYLLSLTAEAVGGAASVLRRVVAYVSEREQFGKRIADFQAVRHLVADMHTGVENSRSILYEAGWRVATHAPDARVWALAARVYSAGTYRSVCESGIQCFGGTGFTWEGEIHLWYRHAIASATYVFDIRLCRQLLTRVVANPGTFVPSLAVTEGG